MAPPPGNNLRPPTRGGGFAPPGSRSDSALVRSVTASLARDPQWRTFAENGAWVCPFCLAGVHRRPGRSVEESLATHLTACRGWNGGEGEMQPAERIAERIHFENLTIRAATDPAWRVYDHEGVWFCPACLNRVLSCRLQNGQITSFVHQAMGSHLSRCHAYLSGQVHPPAAVEQARDRRIQIPALAAAITGHLQKPSWRYASRGGAWICPCCLQAVPEVPLRGPSDWQLAPEGMSRHLLTDCSAYRPDRLVVQPEQAVRAAAAESAVNPYSTSRIARRPGVGTSRIGLVRTPVQGSPSAAAPPPRSADAPPAADGIRRATDVGGSILDRLAAFEVAAPPAAPAPPAEAPAPPPTADPEAQLDWMDRAEDRVRRSTPPPPDAAASAERDDMERAAELQQDLLAMAPVIPGYQFATRFVPCAGISGDFYEFITLPDRRIGFAVGDVSGHGMQAGLIMSMAKKTLEIYAGGGGGPAEVVARVNEALHRDLAGKMFISLTYAVLDPAARSITWVRAGHNPTIRCNPASGTIEEIKPKGMVVGMKGGPLFRQTLEEVTTRIEPGDVFLLYTDGVTETMNPQGEEFGNERLLEVVRNLAAEGPEALVTQILDRVRHFRGAEPEADDLTLLALSAPIP